MLPPLQHLNHHQASIFLKTSLWQYLDMEHQYCYLDTDIIAIDEQIDEVFDQFQAPISFSTDHRKMLAFSPVPSTSYSMQLRLMATILMKSYTQDHHSKRAEV
jgi:hypothetical protein